jgi:hypothetical protein
MRQMRRRHHIEPQAFLPRDGLQETRDTARNLLRIATIFRDGFFAILARQGDHIVEQGLQAAAGVQHHLHMVAIRPFQFGALQKLRHAEHRAQRRADLMAHICDEERFRGGFARSRCPGCFVLALFLR